MSFPKGICVCNLSSPLTFVGLTRFVSAILEGEPGNTIVVIINIEDYYPAIEPGSDRRVASSSLRPHYSVPQRLITLDPQAMLISSQDKR